MLKFPQGFLWGSATSSHQVEGDNHNDWTVWEKENVKIKVQNAKFQNWPDYILNPLAGGPNPLQEENYISGRACGHFDRFEEDFEILKSLNQNAYRFSLEWSRIEPVEGEFDLNVIKYYQEMIWSLRKRGIEPFVTLWHWTLPYWVAKNGGWQ
ncbi:family 1 glycosylhydrolase, partial [Patescibacteria group bacterium]|nr:family 1 glycosylhydrolase [Patescibacteria group bacterium]